MTTLAVLLAACGAGAQEAMDHDHDHPPAMESSGEEAISAIQSDAGAAGDEPRSATEFSTATEGLPDARPTEVITLSDGDTYQVTAGYVKKRVGDRTLRMLAYNGSIPGPLIQVPQGGEIRINFKNDTDVDLTVHSHGVRVENGSDGVPGVTQDSVRPGGTFTYTLKFRDPGMFWYHPHVRADYGQELGLYGNYLIEPSEPGYWNPVDREVPLVLDDVLLDEDGIVPFYREFTNYALLGRFGNEFLVNGRKDYALEVKRGEVVRFFLTNVSNARSYNLSLPGVPFKLVGTDLGKVEHESFTDHFLISPAERVVIEAYFKNAGSYHLVHTQPDGQVRLATIEAPANDAVPDPHAASFRSLRHNAGAADDLNGFRAYLDAAPDKELLLTIDLEGQMIDHSQHTHMHAEEDMIEMHDHSEHVTESIKSSAPYQPLTPDVEALNTLQWSDPEQSDRTHETPDISWKLVDLDTGKASMDIDDWVFKAGELVKIRLTNDENADHIMQHPMHLHGQRFVVLSVNGLPNNNLAWKDTVLVFPGQTVDILVEMDNTGEWMAHCHISEHLHAGMMLTFRVEDGQGHAAGDEYRDNVQEPHHH